MGAASADNLEVKPPGYNPCRTRVIGERLLTEFNSRIRSVSHGRDGALYVLTDGSGGKIVRLVTKKAGSGGRP